MSGFSFEISPLVIEIPIFQDIPIEVPECIVFPSDAGMGVFWGYRCWNRFVLDTPAERSGIRRIFLTRFLLN